MKTKLIAIITLVLTTLFLSSCITSHDTHLEISCDTLNENPTGLQDDVKMEIGDKLYVKLCSNPSTGFSWDYEITGDNAIKEEGYDFEEQNNGVVGAPGMEVWTFEATAKGTTLIDMEYSQPWEGGLKGQWKYRINVVVK